jgi:hypothetical protein
MPTAEQLQILVSNVIEPITEKPLGELRMVRDTFVNGNDARVRIELADALLIPMAKSWKT